MLSRKENKIKELVDIEEREKLTFFYHPDQLNSTSFVTDVDGNAVQFISYIPYGEVFVEERNSSFSSSYLFNAKELDSETGLYYYGARYLDPQNASWLGVDPLWEKYSGVSPYSYCVGNPVRLVDPDGRDWYDTGKGKFEWYDTDKKWTEFGSRVGRDFETYDEDGNLWHYGGNGQCSQVVQVLPEFVVEGKEKSFSDRVVEFAERADCYADEFGCALGNFLFYADAYSIYISGSLFLGGGGTFSAEVGYLKNNGWFYGYSTGVGFGYDCSLGTGVKSSIYSGSIPMTIESYGGEGNSVSLGVKLLDTGYSFSNDNNWPNFNKKIFFQENLQPFKNVIC